MSDEFAGALIAGVFALVVGVLSAVATVLVSERRLRRDFRLEFSAESAVRELLLDPEWTLRSFKVIKHHLGGFSDDELRQVLVRAGALRFVEERR